MQFTAWVAAGIIDLGKYLVLKIYISGIEKYGFPMQAFIFSNCNAPIINLNH